jgi:hypothetical protein
MATTTEGQTMANATQTTGSTAITIYIVSRERYGVGPIHREVYEGAMSVRALKSRLTRERAGGDRLAHCEVETATRAADMCSPEEAIAAARAEEV